MGKSLIIKGADFSANGIQEDLFLDITTLVAPKFLPQHSISGFASLGTNASSNAKRCCVGAFLFSGIGVDISKYSKIELTIKSGFDYVFGTGPLPGSPSGANWQGWSGENGGQAFAWVTANQKAIATVDATTLAISMNLRHDDNTTEFPSDTVLTDIVESIILYP